MGGRVFRPGEILVRPQAMSSVVDTNDNQRADGVFGVESLHPIPKQVRAAVMKCRKVRIEQILSVVKVEDRISARRPVWPRVPRRKQNANRSIVCKYRAVKSYHELRRFITSCKRRSGTQEPHKAGKDGATAQERRCCDDSEARLASDRPCGN